MFSKKQIEEARELIATNTGDGVQVAILDTGIDWSHPMLEGLSRADDIGFDPNTGRAYAIEADEPDPFGHGTAVASIIYRLAPKVKLGSIRVLSGAARGASPVVHEGAKIGIRSGYHCLHCSFGSQMLARLPSYKTWIDEAYVNSVQVVSATSNLGATRTDYPSHFPTVLGVTGKTRAETYSLEFIEKQLIQLCLPADDFRVAWCNGSTNLVGGTSFAAPIVTALVVRLLETWPEATPLELKALLIQLAKGTLDLTDLLKASGVVESVAIAK
ncbi:MAG: S8 family serine peptidase [Opitutales bacterium]